MPTSVTNQNARLVEQTKTIFLNFLKQFKKDGQLIFINEANDFYKHERSMLHISFTNLREFNFQFSNILLEHCYEIYPILCSVAKQFIEETLETKINKQIYIGINDLPTLYDIREINTSKLGMLLKIRGQVTRTYPVHPELVKGTFICDQCDTKMDNIAQEFKYTQPTICHNPKCGNRTNFSLDVDNSTFVDFQKVRIQETQDKIPRGGMPRSLEMILRSEIVESIAQPGIKCDFVGMPIVIPDISNLGIPGIKSESYSSKKESSNEQNKLDIEDNNADSLSKEMSYRIAFLVLGVKAVGNQNFSLEDEEDPLYEPTVEEIKSKLTEDEWKKIIQMSNDSELFKNIANSIFPNIHGNESIKKGIVLMLFGGVQKHTTEAIPLRGDINICIVGEPSTAKSQFLTTVSRMCPRSVYTSGKASTSAGLTAAVVRDDETGEFVIEAGALMLSNNGICCIDEFDKMDVRDQVAIHEAMEQQTISIAKAGVKATLSAKASILAAANPVFGRYDRERSLRFNIRMSAPIMSRFDLFYVLLDECDQQVDSAVAQRILDVHIAQLSGQDSSAHNIAQKYTLKEIVKYIAFARLYKPRLSLEAKNYLVNTYKQMRAKAHGKNRRDNFDVTVRQLESLIRLSEALARLSCKDAITVIHAKVAYELMSKSMVNVEKADIVLDDDEIEMMEASLDEENVQPVQGIDNTVTGIAKEMTSRNVISYDEYKRISKILLMKLKWFTENQDNEDDDAQIGMKKNDLVNWYLEQVIENEVDTEEGLRKKKFEVDVIIERLVKVDKVLIKIHETTLKPRDGTTLNVEQSTQDDFMLMVHPNVSI